MMFNVFKTPEFKKALTFYKEGVKENKRSFIVSMLSAVVWCFLIVIQPYIIKRIIDEGIVGQNQQILIVLISFMLIIGYIRATTIGVRRFYSMHVSYNVEAGIRNRIFTHMQKLAFNFHDKVPTGELMARASSDASQVRLAFAIAPLATANILLLIILSITLLSLSLPLGSMVLLSIPAVLCRLQQERGSDLFFDPMEAQHPSARACRDVWERLRPAQCHLFPLHAPCA